MAPKFVFIVTTLLGSATAAGAALMMAHDRSLGETRFVPAREIIGPMRISTATRAPEPAPIEIEPVLITSEEARSEPARAPRPEASDEAKPLSPCSDWQKLGPTYVNAGDGSGERRVRELC